MAALRPVASALSAYSPSAADAIPLVQGLAGGLVDDLHVNDELQLAPGGGGA